MRVPLISDCPTRRRRNESAAKHKGIVDPSEQKTVFKNGISSMQGARVNTNDIIIISLDRTTYSVIDMHVYSVPRNRIHSRVTNDKLNSLCRSQLVMSFSLLTRRASDVFSRGR